MSNDSVHATQYMIPYFWQYAVYLCFVKAQNTIVATAILNKAWNLKGINNA